MSGSFELSNAVMNFYQLTRLNVFALNLSGAILTMHAPLQIPEGLNEGAFSAIISAAANEPKKCVFWHDGALSYMGGMFDQSTIIIAGPFINQSSFSQKHAPSLDVHILQNIPIFSKSVQLSAANLLIHLSNIAQVETVSLHASGPAAAAKIYRDEETDASIINLRYRLSNEMMHAVETGNMAALKKNRQQAGGVFDSASRFPNKPLRALKNNLIILNTILRLAAERGGVPPVLLHRISEKFALAIEQLTTLQALEKLNESMGVEYCQAVLDNQLKPYSMLIKKAIRFLHVHFTESFELAELANELDVHPVHLSRQFKKETGKTLSQFLQELRLKEAKWLLKESSDPIEHIAGQCGFEDASYFSHLFKKETGMTPRQWRSS